VPTTPSSTDFRKSTAAFTLPRAFAALRSYESVTVLIKFSNAAVGDLTQNLMVAPMTGPYMTLSNVNLDVPEPCE
jgi:hypothetical protein